MSEIGNWYFTFGMAHRFGKKYMCFENMTEQEAREKMHDIFGTNWGFVYSEEEWNNSFDRYFYDHTELK